MLRQIIVTTENTLLLHLPDELVGKKVEVIAFSTEDINVEKSLTETVGKRTMEEARAFYKKNAVDFSILKKWNREDLYE
jgi:hypothetical protein